MTTLTLTARDLRDLIEPVLPHASTDDLLPVLCAVKIRTSGKWLIATATNRFQLAFKRIAAPEGRSWPEFEAVIPTKALRRIMTTFKGTRHTNPEISIAIEGDAIRVSAGGELDGFFDASMRFAREVGEFPNVDQLIHRVLKAPTATEPQGFDFARLAAFKGAQERHGAITVRFTLKATGAPGPALMLGEDFIGILMPRQISSGPVPSGSDWLGLLGPKAPAEKKATAA